MINDRYAVGIILAYVLKELPFIALMVLALLARLGDEYDQLAQTLGASRWQRLRHVTLPLIAPAVISSSVVVFSFIFGAFEVPYILGRPYPAMLSVIAQRRYLDVDLAQRRIDRRRHCHRGDDGAARLAQPEIDTQVDRDRTGVDILDMRKATREDRFILLGRTLSAAFVVGLAAVPLLLLGVWSFSRSWFWPALLPREWSIRAWRYVMTPTAEVLPALGTSLGLATTVTIISLLIAVPAALLAFH
ncbi:MAG: ABC transporter permease subunit [Acidobacteria bacterium]|nr:ABC transporter permease subunit [Acidobacteriota bacterium]